jgi:hypothetical protein
LAQLPEINSTKNSRSAVRICGQIRITKYSDYDKNAPSRTDKCVAKVAFLAGSNELGGIAGGSEVPGFWYCVECISGLDACANWSISIQKIS